MSLDTLRNFAKGTASTGYDASATAVVLAAGHGARFPVAPFNGVWWNSSDYPDPSDDPNVEIVRVTAVVSDTLTVSRAQEGTAATTKNTAGKTYKLMACLTAASFNNLPRRLDAPVTPVALASLATAQDIFSLTIPANTLAPGDLLRVVVPLRRTGTGANLSYRISLGAGQSSILTTPGVAGALAEFSVIFNAGGQVMYAGGWNANGALFASPAAITVDPTAALVLKFSTTSTIGSGDTATFDPWAVTLQKAS